MLLSRHEPYAPQFIGENAVIENCSITEGCDIEGTVKNSVIGPGVKIGKGAVVKDSVIFDNVLIDEGATVSCAIIDSGVCIGKNANVGAPKENAKGVAVVGAGVKVGDGEIIADSEMIYGGKEK